MDLQPALITSHSTRQPWHGRSLVTLPTTQRLGLENFTIHPETPPPQFLPVRIRDDDFKVSFQRFPSTRQIVTTQEVKTYVGMVDDCEGDDHG